MTVYAGILHDSYTNEKGKEVSYTDKIIGCLKGNIYKCVSIPDMMSFDMSKKEFLAKVTDIKELWSK